MQDTGIGVSEEMQKAVFDKFRQADSSTRDHAGVGLGLYIVKQFTEMLGGTIALESRFGSGSKFTVTLPAESTSPNFAGEEDGAGTKTSGKYFDSSALAKWNLTPYAAKLERFIAWMSSAMPGQSPVRRGADLAYTCVARERKLPLVTFDHGLHEFGKAGLEVYCPGDVLTF